MKTIAESEINPIKMSVNPPKEIVDSEMKIIDVDGFIYQYVGIGWIRIKKANQYDFLNIPQLI